MHLVVGRRKAYKYTWLKNPREVGGGRLWGKIGAAGLNAQRCSRHPAQPGNSLSRKGKSGMPKMIYCPIHPALYTCVPEHLASMRMYAYVSEFERKRKTFLQEGKIMRKCLTSYCYIYFGVRLHLFLKQNQMKKEKCFLVLWKSNSMFIPFLETSKESFH